MEPTKLMKLTYCDPQNGICLTGYADVVVWDSASGQSPALAALRFGGCPEVVCGLADAIYGGGAIEIEGEVRLTLQAQEALASQVNINASAITRIEGGQRMVSVPTLRALAEALGVSCDSLLQAERTPPVHKSNINFMLDRQSETSLAHLERVLQVCISEYGDATEEEM